MKNPPPIQPSRSLDLRGFSSPLTPLMVRQALAALGPGQALEVWLGSAQGVRDLVCVLEHSGDACLLNQATHRGYRLLLAKGAGRGEEKSSPPLHDS